MKGNSRPGLRTAPLRDLVGIAFHLDFYPPEDLDVICKRSAQILAVEIDEQGAREIAKRSRGTPRIVNRLLRRVRDYAQVDYDGHITQEVAKDALNRMEVDKFGLDGHKTRSVDDIECVALRNLTNHHDRLPPARFCGETER